MQNVAVAATLDARAVTEREAAKFIGYSVYWLRWARRQNRGPAYLQVGRSIRYRVVDLESWLEAHRVRTREAS